MGLRRRFSQAVFTLAFACSVAPAASKPAGSPRGIQLPLVFEVNRGQAAPGVRFLARGSGFTLLLEEDGAVMKLPSSELRMRLAGSRRAGTIDALDPHPGTSSYFMGNDPAKWRTGIPRSGRVRYTQVYKGIDLVFKTAPSSSRFEYDFVVAAGADPSTIGVVFDGARSIESDGDGGIILHTESGEIRQPQPSIYQDLASGRKEIPGRMRLSKGNVIRFDLGAYDHTRTLVIDPIVAIDLYGSVDDLFGGIARDRAGNVYVTGSTASPDFPYGNTIGNPLSQGNHQVFVAKLSPDLTTFYYSVIIGGRTSGSGNGIQVDNAGNAYVVGTTFASDFPVVNGAQSTFGGKNVADPSQASDAFILKLDPKGATLLYSTFLGGDGANEGLAIAVDGSGAAYATGVNASFHFPSTPGAISIGILFYGGLNISGVFVAKLSPSGSSFDYVANFGGSTISEPVAISVDSGGNAYVAGFVFNDGPQDFPIVGNVVQPNRRGSSCTGCLTGFVSKLNPNGSAFVFSTYFGGSVSDRIVAQALDAQGNIYIVGTTSSPDLPVTPGVVGPTSLSNNNAFIAALNNSGSAIVANSYLGGTTKAAAEAVIVRAPGVIGIAGSGLYDFVGFPLTANALGGIYLELDPLFKAVTRADPPEHLASQYTGLAAAPDGSVAIGGTTNILPNTTGQLTLTNRNGVVLLSTPAPAATVSLVTLSGVTNPASVTAGSNFSYVFTVTNTGTTAITNLKLTTTFSGAAVQIVGGSISSGYCPLLNPSVPFPCIDASLAPGATTVLTVTGTALLVGSAQASASLTWDGGAIETAQVNANSIAPQGNLQFTMPVSESATSGTPVAVALSMANVFLLDSNVEIFSGASLAAQTPVTLQAGGTPAGLLAVDFNADGVVDLAVLDSAADAITTYLGANPGYTQTQTFTTGVSSTAVAMLNLTGTPGSGLIAVGANGIALFSSNGDGTFNPAASFDVAGRQGNLVAVAAGSFTNVGFDDLVVADAAGDIFVIPSDGMGGFGNPIMTQADVNPVAFAVGDFNGDGYLDLAVANSGSGDVSLLLGDGAGDLGPATNFPVGVNPLALTAVDLDGDGNLDLAVVVNGTNTVALLRGDGAGGMGTPLQYAVGASPVAIAVGDIDGDGLPDIAVATGGSVSILLNQHIPQSSSKVQKGRIR
jgi:hypothetical protein